MNKQMEREEQQLEDDLASGAISQSEFNQEMRQMQRDYRDAAEGAAWDAHQAELDRW